MGVVSGWWWNGYPQPLIRDNILFKTESAYGTYYKIHNYGNPWFLLYSL